MESELQDRDAAEVESTSRTPSSASCTGYTSQAATAGEYYGPMEAAMKEMLQALQVQVEHLGDLQDVVRKLSFAAEALVACLAVKPPYGLTAHVTVVDLVRSQLVHRAECSELLASPGPLEWLPQLHGIMQGWHGLSCEDQELEFDDINGDLEMHSALVQYCLDEFDELMEMEAQNEVHANSQHQKALPNRLEASLAGR
jgi:hypothetical protein